LNRRNIQMRCVLHACRPWEIDPPRRRPLSGEHGWTCLTFVSQPARSRL